MVSGAKEIGQILGKAIFQITNVDAFSLSSYRYDAVFHSWNTYDSVSVDEVDRLHLESHPCFDILKYISSGSFYFSSTWNLSVSFQKIFSNPFPTEYSNSSFLYDDGGSCGVDRRFWWNRNLLLPLLIFSAYLEANLKEIFENSDFLIPIISGFVYIRPLTESQPSFILISRLGAKRAGTRFLSRGLDDEGNVANFVETEFVLLQRNFLFSLIQIRGSVPIFWEQQGIQLVQPRLQFTRSFDATQIAFRNHFDDLLHHYGEVHVVNLLSSKEGTPENGLRQTFERHLSALEKNKPVGYTSFDFNASAKDSFSKVTRILEYIGQNIEAGQFFLYDLTWRSIISTQNSTFRVNCLDCLDRYVYYILIYRTIDFIRLEQMSFKVVSRNMRWIFSGRHTVAKRLHSVLTLFCLILIMPGQIVVIF